MSERNIREQLKTWILERGEAKGLRQLDDDVHIIDDGFLTSLDVVELILFVENLRDEEVDIESLEPAYFASINSIYDAFFLPHRDVLANAGGG